MHEVAHRWLFFATLSGEGLEPDGLLGRGRSHWSFYAQSHGSYLEGNEIEEQEGGLFVTRRVPFSYNLQDLYLMGFARHDEVDAADQPFYVEGEDGLFPDVDTRAPLPNAGFFGIRRDYSIAHIIAAEGPRVPDVGHSPKGFRMAIVLVTRDGEEPSVASLAKAQSFASELELQFHRRTLERGRVQTALEPRD
jgi:hypothetical protein